MRYIKTYEQHRDLTNEEINLKKALVGAALGASLMGGMTSCKKEDIKPVKEPTEQVQSVKVDISINIKDFISDNGPSYPNGVYGFGLSYNDISSYGTNYGGGSVGTNTSIKTLPGGWIYLNGGMSGIMVFWAPNGKLLAVDRKSPFGGKLTLGGDDGVNYLNTYNGCIYDKESSVRWWIGYTNNDFGENGQDFPGEDYNGNLLDKKLTFYNVEFNYSSGEVRIKSK